MIGLEVSAISAGGLVSLPFALLGFYFFVSWYLPRVLREVRSPGGPSFVFLVTHLCVVSALLVGLSSLISPVQS